MPSPIAVPEVSLGIDSIPDQLLQFLGFRKPPFGGAVKNYLLIQGNPENPVPAGNEFYACEILPKGKEQLLGQPSSPQDEPALAAIGYGNLRFAVVHSGQKSKVWVGPSYCAIMVGIQI